MQVLKEELQTQQQAWQAELQTVYAAYNRQMLAKQDHQLLNAEPFEIPEVSFEGSCEERADEDLRHELSMAHHLLASTQEFVEVQHKKMQQMSERLEECVRREEELRRVTAQLLTLKVKPAQANALVLVLGTLLHVA